MQIIAGVMKFYDCIKFLIDLQLLAADSLNLVDLSPLEPADFDSFDLDHSFLTI